MREYSYGSILHKIKKDVKVEFLIGYPKNKPQFTDDNYKDLWDEFWVNKSGELGIKYLTPQSEFEKNSRSLWSNKEVKQNLDNMEKLLALYNSVAEKYNKEIAEPFIKSQKNLLNKIIGNLD